MLFKLKSDWTTLRNWLQMGWSTEITDEMRDSRRHRRSFGLDVYHALQSRIRVIRVCQGLPVYLPHDLSKQCSRPVHCPVYRTDTLAGMTIADVGRLRWERGDTAFLGRQTQRPTSHRSLGYYTYLHLNTVIVELISIPTNLKITP